jgi:hypothetical protein
MFGVPAWATGIDEACADLAGQKPADYDEQQQQDFLANYYALGGTFSGVHGPIPHEGGKGMIGIRVNGLPPLPCRRRFALDWTKTEDTNKSPALPALTASFGFKAPKGIVPYVEVGLLPPVPVAGTRNILGQMAAGVGVPLGDHWQVGARAHLAIQRTVGEIATPVAEGDAAYYDLFLGSSLGAQALAGYKRGPVTPYLALGILDVSTFFFVGDSRIAVDNLHPYLGMDLSVGVDGLVAKDRLRWGIEYYGAPGGARDMLDTGDGLGFGAYGRIHTVRLRVGLEM